MNEVLKKENCYIYDLIMIILKMFFNFLRVGLFNIMLVISCYFNNVWYIKMVFVKYLINKEVINLLLIIIYIIIDNLNWWWNIR